MSSGHHHHHHHHHHDQGYHHDHDAGFDVGDTIFHTLGGLALLISTHLLYAGYWGLGALWVASFKKFGGPLIGGHYGGGYGAYGYGGGYGEGYGGFAEYDSYRPPKKSKGYGKHRSYSYDESDEVFGPPKKHSLLYKKKRGGRVRRDADETIKQMPYPQIYGLRRNINFIMGTDLPKYPTFPHPLKVGMNLKHQPEEERVLFSIRQRDTDNCGLRLVCELAAVRHRPLEWEEWEVLQFIRHGDALFEALYPGEGVRPDSAALRDYREAALFGETAGACADRFSTCSSTAHEMMDAIRVAKKKFQMRFKIYS